MSAAETAAKMELKTAKLKMEMAAAKLAYVRAVAAYEAAKSGEDTALGEKTIPSFSTRADEIVKPKGLQQERKQRRRSPSYRKRLERREKERMEVDSEKTARAEKHEDRMSKADVAVVKLAAAPQVKPTWLWWSKADVENVSTRPPARPKNWTADAALPVEDSMRGEPSLQTLIAYT